MSLPLPVFDHLVINARDRMDDAEACYRGLGFALTPRGYHTLGSINHCAVFGDDYLELVGVPKDAEKIRGEILNFPEGLNGIVFATDDADALYSVLSAAGAPVEPAAAFSRPVIINGKPEDAKFRVVRVKADAVPYGRVYFCQHLTRELVWRDEWRGHPNGATALARAVILAPRPDQTAALYRALFGATALKPVTNGLSLAIGKARLDILTQEWGIKAGSEDRLAGLSVRTQRTKRLVPASEAFGSVLEFVAS